MRIAYFDLGFSVEQYGLHPTRYGGGGVVARYLKEDPEIGFYVFAPKEAFDNVGEGERRDRCFAMPRETCEAIQKGYPLDGIVNGLGAFDLILHPHTCATVNRGGYKGPVVHWCGFDGAAGSPGNDYILFYDPSFTPRFGERAKYVRIGKPVPKACPAQEMPLDGRPYLFQCTRQEGCMGSVTAVKACLDAGIKGVFAGPIREGPILEYIDNKTTFYLGEIGEEEKMRLCRGATLFSLLLEWPAPFNQSIIEAQGQGTPIWINKRGPFLTTYLHHGVNGFDAALMGLPEAFAAAGRLNREDCWRAARAYGVDVMCELFKRAFREIVEEWGVRG